MSFLNEIKAAGGALALALALGVGLAACNEERQDLTQPVGDVGFDFLVSQSLTGGVPGGSAEVTSFAIAEADTSGGDFFEFATAPLGNYVEIETSFGAAMGFDVLSNASLMAGDPRLPEIQEPDAQATSFWGLFNPAWTGVAPAWWDLFGEVEGLKPGTTYTVALARMAVQVNGVLDQIAPLFNLSEDPPDELVFVGGAEAGSHDVTCDFSAGVGVDVDRNPVALGTITTDDSGAQTVDCLPVAVGSSPWWRSASAQTPPGAADSLPFGADEPGATLGPGQYNYILVVEGQGTSSNPLPDVAPAMRIQMGPDIDTDGNPIPHGFAPYPGFSKGEILDQYSEKAAGRVGGITVQFENLPALSGGVYQVWLANVETGDIISPTGNWMATAEGEEVAAADGVKTFNSESGWVHTFHTDDDLAGTPVGAFTHAVVSMEPSEASTPSASQPMWFQHTDMGGAPDDPFQWSFSATGDAVFGSFNGGSPVPWAPRGQGRAIFWGETRGETDQFRVHYRNLQIPPRGFYYEGWFVKDDGATAVSTGPISTEFEDGFQSLRDVDEDPGSFADVSPEANLVVVAADRAFEAELGVNFTTFQEYRLTLTPKMGTGDMPPTTTLGAGLPESLTARAPEEDTGDGGDGGGS